MPRQNKIDGHDVKIIASTEYIKDGKTVYIEPSSYINEDGIPVERLKYTPLFFSLLTNKVKKVDGLYKMIQAYQPDVIFFHGTSSVELKTAAKYKKNHPNIKLYLDSHTDYYTSGTNWISRKILHGVFYRYIIKSSLKYIDKVFYISVNCGDFLKNVYKLPQNKIEFFSLGGDISTEVDLEKDRKKIRKELQLDDDDIFLLQAGKLDKHKKVTEFLNVFSKVPNNNLKLFLIGTLGEDIKKQVESKMQEDSRISYLGWKEAKELAHYLNACDVYVQPGKVSAIAQNAICSSCAVILADLPDYKPFVQGNGWQISSFAELEDILNDLSNDEEQVQRMKIRSREIAEKYLDYKTLAARIYE